MRQWLKRDRNGIKNIGDRDHFSLISIKELITRAGGESAAPASFHGG
jgi:hypothetical protein